MCVCDSLSIQRSRPDAFRPGSGAKPSSFTAVQLKRGEGLLFGPSESDVKPSALPELATASEIVLQKPIFRKRC